MFPKLKKKKKSLRIESSYDKVISVVDDYFDQWDASTVTSMDRCIDSKEDYIEK